MRFKNWKIPAALSLLIVTSPLTFADMSHGSNIATMANVIVHLNHHPSDDEKKTLKSIASGGSASASEKVIATAILNMNHTVSDSDKAKLGHIAADASEPQNVRDLAMIVMNIAHKPSSDDVSKLQAMK